MAIWASIVALSLVEEEKCKRGGLKVHYSIDRRDEGLTTEFAARVKDQLLTIRCFKVAPCKRSRVTSTPSRRRSLQP